MEQLWHAEEDHWLLGSDLKDTCVSGPLHSHGSYESKCFAKLQYMAYMSLLEYYFHYIKCVESESL